MNTMYCVTYWTDASSYAHFVFNAFDQDRNGSISFEVIIFNHLWLLTVILWQKRRKIEQNSHANKYELHEPKMPKHNLNFDYLITKTLHRMSLCHSLHRPHYGFLSSVRPSVCLVYGPLTGKKATKYQNRRKESPGQRLLLCQFFCYIDRRSGRGIGLRLHWADNIFFSFKLASVNSCTSEDLK